MHRSVVEMEVVAAFAVSVVSVSLSLSLSLCLCLCLCLCLHWSSWFFLVLNRTCSKRPPCDGHRWPATPVPAPLDKTPVQNRETQPPSRAHSTGPWIAATEPGHREAGRGHGRGTRQRCRTAALGRRLEFRTEICRQFDEPVCTFPLCRLGVGLHIPAHRITRRQWRQPRVTVGEHKMHTPA